MQMNGRRSAESRSKKPNWLGRSARMAQVVPATLCKVQAKNLYIALIPTMAGRSNTPRFRTTERSVLLVYTPTTIASTRFLMILWKCRFAMATISSNTNPRSRRIISTQLLLRHKTTTILKNQATNHRCSCLE